MKEFLESRWDKKSPLVIAYSGGPDSKALFRAVLSWGKAEIHLAHVDHGWREESGAEAAFLEEEAKALGVSFHLLRLEKKTTEEEARNLRLAYFASLKEKVPYQAVLMGHHANDLAETVLKRLFEGAHLTRLFGMQQESLLEGVLIWRPLLKIPRAAIEKALSARSFSYLTDPSNRDPKYLRARMRESLLPGLEEAFGKGILENLQVLADRSLELDAYLAKRVETIRGNMKGGPFGISIDCERCERVELRALLQEIFPMSRDAMETLLDWVKEKGGREMSLGQRRIIADRGRLFFLEKKLPIFGEKVLLPSAGWARSGDWRIFVGEGERPGGGWEDLWENASASVCIPEEGSFWLSLPPPKIQWKDKAPGFLRKICPCILGENGLAGNFLSPRKIPNGKSVKIFVDYNSL